MQVVTDEERREVARRLRGIDAERIDRRCGPVSSELATLGSVDEAVGSRVEGYTFSATRFRDRLIDLIEPSCDRNALLALSDGLEYRANELIKAAQHARFSGLGPTMERAKHDAYELRIIARRIREACGEAGQ